MPCARGPRALPPEGMKRMGCAALLATAAAAWLLKEYKPDDGAHH